MSAWAACFAAVAFTATVLSAVPAQAVTGYHVVVGSLGVNARSGPGTAYSAVGKLYNGQAIDIACQTKGSLVGVGLPGTPTDVWDKLANGWYITDYYTSTTGVNGSYTPGIPQCGAAAPPAPAPAPPAVNQPLDGCAQVRVFGVRGSGEPWEMDPAATPTPKYGMGAEVDKFYQTLSDQLHGHGVDVRWTPIHYDAIPVPNWSTLAWNVWNGYFTNYYNSVQYGKNLLTLYVSDHLNKCPSEHIILAGYSQGADVVHQVWNSLTAGGNAGLDRWRTRLDGLILFADPRFDVSQKNAIPALSLDEGSFGNYNGNYNGILAGLPFGNGPVNWFPGQEVYHLMKSYCDYNDIVCQNGFSTYVHTHYNERGVTASAGTSMSQWLIGHYFH